MLSFQFNFDIDCSWLFLELLKDFGAIVQEKLCWIRRVIIWQLVVEEKECDTERTIFWLSRFVICATTADFTQRDKNMDALRKLMWTTTRDLTFQS